jgi:ribosomal protein L11 methyltransferase
VQPDEGKKTWWVARLTLESETEEPISTVLWNAGTVGISSRVEANTVVLNAYFADRPHRERLQFEIESFLAELGFPNTHLRGIELEPLVEEDWSQKWKEGYHPIALGERFIIAPSWEKPTEPGVRMVIEIDPGMAFGTGTHETTQLCLIAIERYWCGGRFLDIGTGTGILAIAAAKLHPDAQVVAVDIDPIAIEVAGENVAQNNVAEKIELLLGAINRLRGRRFDLVVANLTAQIIEAELDQIKELLADEAVLILSGVLAEQEPAVLERLTQTGLPVVDRFMAGEWVVLVASEDQPTAG